VTTDAGKAKGMTALCNPLRQGSGQAGGNIAAWNAYKIKQNGKLLYWAGMNFCCLGRRNAFFPLHYLKIRNSPEGEFNKKIKIPNLGIVKQFQIINICFYYFKKIRVQ
jgi:hypothetical protein